MNEPSLKELYWSLKATRFNDGNNGRRGQYCHVIGVSCPHSL